MILSSGDLVAISEPPGPRWLSHVRRTWEAGAALLPLDPRLGATQRSAIVAAAAPTCALADGKLTRLDGRPAAPGTGLVIATSGTTGVPKAVELSRIALGTAVRTSAARLGLHGNESWGCPIPVAHIGGMLVVLRATLLGVPVHFSSDPATPSAWSSIVPTQLRRLVAQRAPLQGRAFLVGGDRLDDHTRRAAEERGARIVATYGMSETSGGVVYDGLPLEGVDVRVGAGDRIEIRSPTLFTGYRDGGTREGEWFATGDRGHVQADRLTVDGRIDDVVIIGGEKVSRSSIGETIAAIAGVRSVRVEAATDADLGAGLDIRYSGDVPVDVVREALRDAHSGLVASVSITLE